MKNTSVIIPILLAICVATIVVLLYRSFGKVTAAEQPAVVAVEGQDNVERRALPMAPSSEIAVDEEAPIFDADEDLSNNWAESEVAKELLAGEGESYIVLAGSFRQKINAEQQVRKLQKAGFADSQVSLSNRGAYAVAFVGRRASRSEAEELLGRLTAKGFTARVLPE